MTILYWVLLVVMFVGIAGSILPAVPGPSLILIAALVWLFATSFSAFNPLMAAVFVVLILSSVVEILGTYLGAKQFGASNWGQIGAIVGLVLGVVGLLPALPFGGPILGFFFGPIVGAFVGEFLYRREMEMNERISASLKACIGIIVGTVIGKLFEFLLATVAVVIFVFSTWPQVMG